MRPRPIWSCNLWAGRPTTARNHRALACLHPPGLLFMLLRRILNRGKLQHEWELRHGSTAREFATDTPIAQFASFAASAFPEPIAVLSM
jgi:hypothetical protein